MPTRFAFSTNAFTRVNVFEAVREIAACGYEGVEIMADVPHAWPATFGADERARLRASLEAHGLAVSNVNAFMMYGHTDCYHPAFTDRRARDRRDRLEHTREAMILARDLGAASVSIEPGGPVPGRRVQGPVLARRPTPLARERGQQEFVRALENLGALGERLHVDVLVEPEPGLLVESAREFESLMADLAGSYPRIGLNFDVGHFYCVKEDPADLVPRLAEWTRHYHLEDIAETREHRHLVPGEGAIDLGRVLRAIASSGYDGFITVEVYPEQEAPAQAALASLEHVRSLTADRGVDVAA